MANTFSKEERVAFEMMTEGFEDALVLSRNVNVFNSDSAQMERSNDTIWRPAPYILNSVDGAPGTDIGALYQDATQLSVPATLGFSKTAPWTLNASELRDALQENRLGDAAKQRIASDINIAVMNVAAAQGTVVVARPLAAAGYDDVAECDAVFNEQGIPMDARYLALSSRDYNGMASNLAARQTMNQKPTNAYERSYVGPVAGFETYKMDYANRIAVGAGTYTADTTGGNVDTVPASTVATVNGQNNVDNRTQNLTTTSNTGVVAGDCITIAGINSVHHITKQDTGQLKTFRVISVTSGTVLVISPQIVTASTTPTDAELQYKNCELVSTSGTAACTKLNIAAAAINPFWHKDSIELMPGRYAGDTDGATMLRYTSEQGIELTLTKQFEIDTRVTKYRLDTFFGVTMCAPEMAGIVLFGQT